MDKERWVKEHLGFYASQTADTVTSQEFEHGDYLIDDSPKNGAAEFSGKWLQFGKALTRIGRKCWNISCKRVCCNADKR